MEGVSGMIDTHGKPVTDREAVAVGRVRMSPEAIRALRDGKLPKGDALGVARIAGVLAAKRTPELIPYCHPIPLSHVDVRFDIAVDRQEVTVEARARAEAPTGVEMEALTAVAVAALTIHDMCKALDPGAEIAQVHLVQKSGGRTGKWERRGS
jgi:cyclic pyranopterin phosphate synthase